MLHEIFLLIWQQGLSPDTGGAGRADDTLHRADGVRHKSHIHHSTDFQNKTPRTAWKSSQQAVRLRCTPEVIYKCFLTQIKGLRMEDVLHCTDCSTLRWLWRLWFLEYINWNYLIWSSWIRKLDLFYFIFPLRRTNKLITHCSSKSLDPTLQNWIIWCGPPIRIQQCACSSSENSFNAVSECLCEPSWRPLLSSWDGAY